MFSASVTQDMFDPVYSHVPGRYHFITNEFRQSGRIGAKAGANEFVKELDKVEVDLNYLGELIIVVMD